MGSKTTAEDVDFLRRQAKLSRAEGFTAIASQFCEIAEKLASTMKAACVEMGGVKKQSSSMLDKWCIHVTVRDPNGTYQDFIKSVFLRQMLQEVFADPEMRKLIGTAIAEAPIPIYQMTPGSAYAPMPTRKESSDV